ncbi:MAG: adenylosuccinate lyase [Bacteroidota bacterium]
MKLSDLTAIGPLDGRYRKRLAPLAAYFSEMALIRYRILVEIEYFIHLSQSPISQLAPLQENEQEKLRNIYLNFTAEQAEAVKEIEKTTNHDVKAVEYFIKSQIESGDFPSSITDKLEFIHFGLTSQDINNTATPLMLKEFLEGLFIPQLDEVIAILHEQAREWKDIPMLARTHGQPASPTTLGKEFEVFVKRLSNQLDELKALEIPGKFGGATGNMNAHYIAYPEVDWEMFAQSFVEDVLGLKRSYPSTQIDHYDGLARIFDNLRRINTIMIDLCQDVWIYISMEYFRQKVKAGEVGSSAMPHKVNPIDFENAEGNSGLSSALLEFLSRKLPVSRLQRDLTDSTVLRNLGLAVGYAYLAQLSLKKGLGKLLLNESAIERDLEKNWAVLAEAIQTILRREQFPKPYEALKNLTRGNATVNAQTLLEFVNGLDVKEEIKEELRRLSPSTYVGNASDQV